MTNVHIALLAGIMIGIYITGGALLVAEIVHAWRSGEEDRS